jgi:hypothetical protein
VNEMFTTKQFLDAGTTGFQNGRKTEQERIIKLLEKYEVGGSDPDTYDHIPHEQLIVLIKGEQNG